MPINIVIVEDLDEVRSSLSNFLQLSNDFSVTASCATAEEALKQIPENRPDIVIMDINLPGISGIDCIRRLKQEGITAQFMMFTVYENDEKVFESIKAGATGYLLKNTGLLQIAEAVKELYNGGSPISANIARKLVMFFQEREQNKMDGISKRENEILHLLARGLLYKEIAVQLSISVHTVRQHIHSIYEKLHVQNRTEALNKAFGK